jgi:hypothetical protein
MARQWFCRRAFSSAAFAAIVRLDLQGAESTLNNGSD